MSTTRAMAGALLEGAVPGRRLYRFAARDDGGRRTGFIRADSRENALAALAARRWVPLSLEEVRPEGRAEAGPGRPGASAVLLRQLAVLYRSGVPLAQGLEVLREQSDEPAVWRALARVGADLQAGQSLSAAVRRRSDLFPPWCASALAAAEASGTVAETLDRLADGLERSVALRRRVLSAITYPATVLGLALLLNLSLFHWMIPAFLEAFQQAEIELPALSRLVVGVAALAGDPLLLAGLAAAGLAGWLLLRRPRFRRLRTDLLERLPLFGGLVRTAGEAEVYRHLAAMLAAGSPMQTALARAVDLPSSTRLAQAMARATARVVQGAPLSEAMEKEGFNSLARHLAGAAEESGDYPGMLRRAADSLAEDVEVAVASLTSVIEPVLVAVVGTLIAVFTLALFLPLYTTASAW